MKKIICALLPIALLFTSCRFQDNSTKTSMPIGGFDPEPVSQAFNGVEKLQGQDFGVFTMPDKITVPDNYEIYKLTIDQTGQEMNEFSEQDAKRIFKKYYGDNYKEENCKIIDGFTGQIMMYYTDDDSPIGSYGESESVADNSTNPLIIYNRNTEGNDIISSVFQLKKGEDGEVEVDGKKIKASEIAKNAKEWTDDIEKNVSISNGFGFEAKDVFAFHSRALNTDYIQVSLAELYKGIDFEEFSANFLVSSNGVDTHYYTPTFRVIYSDDVERPTTISLGSLKKIKESEKLDKIISLEGAVNILRNSLAENMKYDFDKVELMYCCQYSHVKFIFDKNGEITEEMKEAIEQPLTFTPTWCFFFNNEYSGLTREAVKVDAITGEITLDVA